MSITLAKLCANVESTYGMKLQAGASGLENFVRWVHMIEDREVPSFLHGNELVFTTGIAQPDSEEWLLEFTASMIRKNACGLVVNIGPYIKDVPERVIAFCENQGLPLYTVPWSVRLIDITYDFCHRIVASEEIEVGLATAMRNLIFMPQEEKIYRPTLERRCFYPDAEYSVVAFEPILEGNIILDDDQVKTLKMQAQRLLNKSGKLFSSFFYDRKMIIVLQNFSEKQIKEFIVSLQAVCEQNGYPYKLPAGISPAGKGYLFVSDAFNKAIMGLRIAKLYNKNSVHYQNMGIYKLLVSVSDNNILSEIYDESLGMLEEFDKKNGTDYLNTLRCYLEHDSSVQEVAQLTFVHRNTVNYKIKRIREILQCDFNHENKLKLMLAFYIRDLL